MSFRFLIVLLFTAAPALGESDPIRVAVFQGAGTGPSSAKLIAALESRPDGRLEVIRITAEEIQDGHLEDVDVLVHPGGSGSKQGNALGEQGRAAVREFISGGGGYLGICAGAYLATNDYPWSLNLIDARVVDRKHWARGNGTVMLRLSAEGSAFFQDADGDLEVYYAQGPLLARREWDDHEVPDYESLAIFATGIAKNGAPQGIMEGTSAAIRCEFGSGRVFCFSPHPELTEGQHHLIRLAVEWLTARQPHSEAP